MKHISPDWPSYRLRTNAVQIVAFFVCLINSLLSGKKNESRTKAKGDSLLTIQFCACVWREYNTGRLFTDCNYSTFSVWSWLQLQTITFPCIWVMTPSLSHCLNKARMSAVIINEEENMWGSLLTFWPPWILWLTSEKKQYWLLLYSNQWLQIPKESVPLCHVQGSSSR